MTHQCRNMARTNEDVFSEAQKELVLMSECKQYLRFECGARMPSEGYLDEPFRHLGDSKPRKKDGRTRLVVFKIPDCPTRPVMPDGSSAPCMFGCPKQRASGRKMVRTWPEDDYKPDAPFQERMGYVVTCYPEVIDDADIPPGFLTTQEMREKSQ